MTYALTTPPASEPVSLDEAKNYLRIDHDDDDELITGLIVTARKHLEALTGLSLMTQSWRLYRDSWPKSGMISLAHGPVASVSSVTVYDAEGNANAVALDRARLDGTARPVRFYLPEIAAARASMNGIEVDFIAGYGAAADVPEPAKAAITRHVAHMYALRGVVALTDQPAAEPQGYQALIAPLKSWRL
ncbi:head-tail connector protein [Martelella sp. HB161492]|uniref:head-tail connector protein n=1 Tax=Martelella sp. HB161492 TaxID=2720726 RepID=UPI0015903B9D|nr:head-tail connector protein [Martelella sp. HB161492]